MNPTFTKSYEASADIDPHLIVRFSDAASSQKVAVATANDQPFVGVSDKMGAKAGGMVDIERGGLVLVRLGGPVEAGDPLTSDDEGRAILAEPAEGETIRIIGYADEPGTEDDIALAFLAPGILHEPAAAGP